MAEIKNIEGLTKPQMKEMISQGGKFVMFQYTISIVVMTFRESSNIYFIKPGESAGKYSWGYTLLTTFMGWWGIPWGPIYTIGTLATNLGGGKNLTLEVSNQLGLNSQSGYNIPGTNSGTTQSSGGYNIPRDNNSNTNTNQSGGYNIPRDNNSNTNSNQSGGYNIPR